MESKFCHHIHQNGTFCQSPPMRGRDYCYTHLQLLGRRMQMAKARARAEKCQLNLPLPEDLHGVQVAIAQLMDAVATDRVDPGRARVLLSALRLAASNLKTKTPWDLRRFQSGNPTDSQVLADSSGNFLASTFLGTTCPPGAHSVGGNCFDVLLNGGTLTPGTYQIALSAFENMSLAENNGPPLHLSDGFTGLGNLAAGENLNYAFDVILPNNVPEPSSIAMFVMGCATWAVRKRITRPIQ